MSSKAHWLGSSQSIGKYQSFSIPKETQFPFHMENKTTNTYLATMSLFDIAYKPTEEYQGQHSMTSFLYFISIPNKFIHFRLPSRSSWLTDFLIHSRLCIPEKSMWSKITKMSSRSQNFSNEFKHKKVSKIP